jgi:hypothetical protein
VQNDNEKRTLAQHAQTWWCLSILQSILNSTLDYNMLGKTFKKVMVSRNLCQAHLLGVGLTKTLRDHET